MSIDINHVTEDMSTSNGEAPTMGGFRVPVNIDSSIGTLTNPRVDLLKGQYKGVATYDNATPDDVRTYIDAGIVYTAKTDEMRFEDGGVLVESTSSNTLTQSGDLTHADWAVNSAAWTAVTSADIVDPSGGTEVTKFTATATPNSRVARQTKTFTASKRSASMYIYVPSGQGISTWRMTGDWQDVEGWNGGNQSVFDQWVRISGSNTVAATRTFIDFNMVTDDIVPSTGFYFYATYGQEEPRGYATSYIVTTTAAQARSADKWSFPTRGNVPHPDNGLAIMIDYEPLADGADMTSMRMFGSNDSGGINYEWRSGTGVAYSLTIPGNGGFAQFVNKDDFIGGESARWLFVYQNVGANVEWSVYKDSLLKSSGSVVGNISIPDDSIEIGYWSVDNIYAEGKYHAFRLYDLLTGEERVLL